MKTAIFALALAVGFCIATPANAGGGNQCRIDSANSLPPGFYDNTPFSLDARIIEQYFANHGESSWLVQRGVIAPLPPKTQTPGHG